MICTIFGGANIRDYSEINVPKGYIIAADRGFIHCERLGITDRVNLLVGDFDSYEGKIPKNINVIKAPAEKDDTDMMLAVKLGLAAGADEFIIYGGSGGRIGHTFANIQTLSYILENGCNGVLRGDSFDARVLEAGKYSFEKGHRVKFVSIFSLSVKSEISVKGLKYGKDLTFTDSFPLGVSNEFSENNCEINVKSGKIAVFFEKM